MRRHILPILITPIIIMCGWLVVSSPILFVFVIDDAFSVSEFIKFIFSSFGISLVISGFIIFPLMLILERVVSKSKIFIAIVPGFVLLVPGCIVWKFVFDRQFIYDIDPWGGRLLLFSFLFVCYWFIFWLLRLIKPIPKKALDMA
jgi:hypothetical protein